MRIGIDAKWFFEGPPSGRRVVYNLVKKLIEINDNNILYIFLDNKFRSVKFPFSGRNVVLLYISANNNLLSNVFIMPKYFNKYKINVVLFQNFVPFVKRKTKYIAFIHDVTYIYYPQYFTWKEKLYFKPLKYLSKFSDTIITVSYSEKNKILENKIGNEKNVNVIHHGLSDDFIYYSKNNDKIKEIKKIYNLPDEYILYVGRINAIKNISNLIIALSLVNNKSIKLVIVGDYDWKHEDLEDLIHKLKLHERVIIKGYIFSNDLPVIYSLAKVLCLVSIKESFGLPALEAMATKTPVIVSNSSSLPEICDDAGIYVDPLNPFDIADKINIILDDKELCKRKSEMGFKQASKFTWDKSAQKLISIFEKLYEDKKCC